MAGIPIRTIEVDITDSMEKIESAKKVLTQPEFEKLMQRTFNEVAQTAKTLIARDIIKDYAAPYSWVQKNIGKWRSIGGAQIGIVIPVSSSRGSIGGTFSASGPSFGISAGKKGKKRGGKIRAKIVRGSVSVLPNSLPHQGGNPPFIGKGGVAFTRRTKKPFPIVSVVGLSVPQMPKNRSQEKITDDINNRLQSRLEHNITFMFGVKL